MKAKNLLILMSDQHSRALMGCYGHKLVSTPHLDALAARGTRFTDCWTPSPVCVPARASFATGKYIHQIGYWDNADPYDGSVPSWHHRLRDAGHQVVSVGKLHFRSDDDDSGFSESIVPMQVIEGKGDLMGLIRDDLPVRGAAYKMARMAGPGESPYTQYDREIAARAQVWLHQEAPKYQDRPWVLFVSFVAPHYPLTAPPEHYFRYFNDPKLPMPRFYQQDERPTHPFVRDYAASFNFDDYFKTQEDIRRAVAGYYGLCSFMDEQAGKVLNALADAGLSNDTRVIYTSDHGDALGKRGLWGKSTLYEETCGVPLIVAGEGIPKRHIVDTPANLVDIYPFIIDCVGESGRGMIDADHPGVSLARLADGEKPQRTVLSEYHGMGSTTGAFAIRLGKFKYVHYAKYPPQLFDLAADPEEVKDLSAEPQFAEVLAQCEAALRAMLSPEDVDARAKKRQAEQLQRHGGREAVIARGDLGFSPPPGIRAEFH
ncbi:choline-sulfatase [Bradyrhizobium lablabi]|uniref:Choline-sulfatase n=1 Tax=Bradyrhizobium lablabi TaxID=722472 RepID=A0A1M6RXF2_9BRAD|nr:sulfatase-like hydrolase/transferase [Bradyrhizobium lablabi]SHK37120.1 choline-sulfatase [Bradyrhizobium lablabi]